MESRLRKAERYRDVAVKHLRERARALDAIAEGWAAMLGYLADRGLQPASAEDRDPAAYETYGDFHLDARYVYPRRMQLLDQVVAVARGKTADGLMPYTKKERDGHA